MIDMFYLSFQLIHPLAQTHAAHRGWFLVISSKTNGYVGKSGPESLLLLLLLLLLSVLTSHFLDGSPGHTASLRRSLAS